MDVVARRPGDVPPSTEIAPPADVLAQIEPKEAPKEPPKVSVHDIVEGKVNPDGTPGPAAQAAAASDNKPAEHDSKQAAADEDEPEKLIQDHKPPKVKAPKAEQPKPVNPPKHGNGVAVAIAVTVIVMLALSGAAVYAYLQSK